jgi:hypothetical protein
MTALNKVNLIIYTDSTLSVRNRMVHELLTVIAGNLENYQILKTVLLPKSSWPNLH